jgi:hypothetical protein
MDYYNYDTLCYPSRLVEWPQPSDSESYYQPNSFVPDHNTSRIKQEKSVIPPFQNYPYHQQRNASYDALNLSQPQHAHQSPYSAIMSPPYNGASIFQQSQYYPTYPMQQQMESKPHTFERWDDDRHSSASSLVEGSELEMVDMDQMSTMTNVSHGGVVEDIVGNTDPYKEAREKWEEILQRPSGNNEWRFQSASSLDTYDEVFLGSSGCKRRRSQSAPISATSSFPVPIPVPNLTKKSRGRRVPTMSSLEDLRSAASGAGRKRQNTGGKTARMYMCDVKGCGKCFARGEHLKRHVRSIHTYEKREVLYPLH